MSLQQVYRLPKRNSFRDLALFEEEVPTPDKHEVLIKVRSVALNYRDFVIANSKYPFPVKENVVPCSDAVGEVVKRGSAVQGLAEGDVVLGSFDLSTLYGPQRSWNHGHGGPIDGVLRQYIALPAQSVVKVPSPERLSFAQWATLPCTGVTAWNSLYGNMPMRPGQTILFQGTGGVSITGLLLAKAAGATTIVTSSSDEKLKTVQEKFGANHLINYKTTPNWAAEAMKIIGGRGVDYILENGGSGTIKQSIEAIAYGGIISVIGFLSAAPQSEMPDVAGLALSKGCVVRGIQVGSTQQLEELVRFVSERNIQMPVNRVFGFARDEVLEAYEHLSSGSHIGKICINVA